MRIPPRLEAFAQQKIPIIVGTTRTNGSPQMNPLWFECVDGVIWLNGGPDRAWLRHARRTGHVTLLLIDPANMWRFAQLQGRFAEIIPDEGGANIEHLSQRYLGAPYRGPRTDRIKIRFELDRLTGRDLGQPWDAD